MLNRLSFLSENDDLHQCRTAGLAFLRRRGVYGEVQRHVPGLTTRRRQYLRQLLTVTLPKIHRGVCLHFKRFQQFTEIEVVLPSVLTEESGIFRPGILAVDGHVSGQIFHTSISFSIRPGPCLPGGRICLVILCSKKYSLLSAGICHGLPNAPASALPATCVCRRHGPAGR